MYYWGLSMIFKNTKHRSIAFDDIVKFLVESKQSLLSTEDSDFTSGLQIAGIICHSCKYNRRIWFSMKDKKLIEIVLDTRLNLATRETSPTLLNAFELVHLKLLAISIAKEQAQYWHKEEKQLFHREQL